MRPAPPLPARLALALATLVSAACAAADGEPGPVAAAPSGTSVPVPTDAQPALVVRVVDGDTLVLRGRGPGPLPGEETRARLLEVDAPESVTPDRPVECFGPEAGQALRALAPEGARLRVTADVEPVDRFGRPLLYAWTDDGVFVNEALVRDGYAEAVAIGANVHHIGTLRAAERAARDEGAGLWGACAAAGTGQPAGP